MAFFGSLAVTYSDLNSTGLSSDDSDFLDPYFPVMDNLLRNKLPAAENWPDIPIDYSLQDVLQCN
jgi:hypothetical protein